MLTSAESDVNVRPFCRNLHGSYAHDGSNTTEPQISLNNVQDSPEVPTVHTSHQIIIAIDIRFVHNKLLVNLLNYSQPRLTRYLGYLYTIQDIFFIELSEVLAHCEL